MPRCIGLQASPVAAITWRTIELDLHVAHLASRATRAEEQLPFHDDPPTDPGADGEIDHVARATSRTRAVFAESSEVGIIAEIGGETRGTLELICQRHVLPARKVRRDQNEAR